MFSPSLFSSYGWLQIGNNVSFNFLPVENEVLPQVEELKYLGVLFTTEGKVKIDRRIGKAFVVMLALYWSVVVKR